MRSLVLPALLVLCSVLVAPPRESTASDARALSAGDIRLETKPVTDVIALWPKDPGARQTPRRASAKNKRAAARLAASAPYRQLREFQRSQDRCIVADADMARVLLYPDSTACGIALDPAFAHRASIDSLARDLESRSEELRERVAREAAAYLPARKEWADIQVFLVLSSGWSFDAVTMMDESGRDPVILVNATEVLSYGSTTKERVETLAHVLAHEVFHAGLRQAERELPGWAGYGQPARSAFAHVSRVLLDEGVAHYIDWKSRPGSDTLFTAKPGPHELRAFQQLGLAAKRLRESGDRAGKAEVLQLASTGPLWSKYGAISGMFAAYRIESRFGPDSLRAAVAGGPGEFIRMYGSVAAADTSLQRVPEEFAGSSLSRTIIR